MQKIEINNTYACQSLVDDPVSPYVMYTGGIAGVTDKTELQSDTEPFQRGADKTQLNGQ